MRDSGNDDDDDDDDANDYYLHLPDFNPVDRADRADNQIAGHVNLN